jgi:superfamily II DNA or RNA helicase
MSRLIGEKGIYVPDMAKDSLIKTLSSLTAVVTIHSDLDGVDDATEQIEADPRMYVQIKPWGEGLDVELAVRPLGPEGASCRPGAGGTMVFGLLKSKRVRTRRNLDAEREELIRVVRSCPALQGAEELHGDRRRIADAESALEFLLQLRELDGSVVPEWPMGETMKIRAHVSGARLSARAHGVEKESSLSDMFSVSGSVQVDDDLVLDMKDLLALMQESTGRFLPLGNGEFIALTKQFQRRVELMASVGELKGNEIRLPALFPQVMGGLDGFIGELDEEWRRRSALIDAAAKMNPAVPKELKATLRNYQAEGYQWLVRLSSWGAGACLADDMGLGKTVQVLAALLFRAQDGPALVVAPTSVCQNWITEAARFAPTLNMIDLRRDRSLSVGPSSVVVASYGLLQNEIERLSEVRWHTIVLDEAQAIKNMDTRRSAAVMQLNGDFRIATTGTPIENHLGELWNIFRFLNPHYLGSIDSFNRRFAGPIERGDDDAREKLKRVIKPFILRRRKEQVMKELPPKTEVILRVDLNEEERAVYEAVRRSAIESLAGVSGANRRFQIFAALTRLRRVCCSAALAVPEERRDEFAEVSSAPSAKMEAFLELLAEIRQGGHRALVFSQFVSHLSLIRAQLDKDGVPYQYFDGATPPDERTKRVAAFQAGEGDCFLISLKAGGMGINLTAADYVIHMDPWWNPAVEEQASDRAHRIGQSRPVTVYRLVARDTVEERIVDLHAWKKDLAESLLEGSSEALHLSADEMLELIMD